MDNVTKSSDILIVGAGVSGLYAAWRLLENDPSLNISIIERLNRVGGRLDTDLICIKDKYDEDCTTVRDEEGGMRFTYEMKELMSLINALKLCDQIVDFPMTTNRYHVRGRSFTYEESLANNNAIWSELYDLAPSEKWLSPGDILEKIYHTILSANDRVAPENPTPEFWQEFRLDLKWNGIPLNQWQMGGLLNAMEYSHECIQMLVDTIGFQAPFLSLANAGEAWQILEDFPKNPHYHTFKYGFSTLTNALEKKVREMGARIHLGVNLNCISKNKNGYTMEISPAQKDGINYPDNRLKVEIYADKVILAIASNAMEKVFVDSPLFNQNVKAKQIWMDIKSIENMRLMKINLYFQEPWWRNGSSVTPIINFGPSFTSQPINAVYPFYPVEGPSDTKPAALTIYCDYSNSKYWQGLQNVGPLFDSPQQRENSKEPQTIFAASQAVVDEALKQLKSLFNIDNIPTPVMTSYRNWDGEDNFGYAYHQWGLNSNDREIIQRMITPIDFEQIYSCNEAWSDMQGWVNGSLRSTDLVLKEFGLESLDKMSNGCKNPDSNE